MSNYRHGTNYYEILEVNRGAPQNEIHKAYQRAKATYSSDNAALYSMFSKEEARELVRMIEEAYAVLGNQAQRKTYDLTLATQAQMSAEKAVTTVPQNSPSEAHPALARPEHPRPEPISHEQLPDLTAPESPQTNLNQYSPSQTTVANPMANTNNNSNNSSAASAAENYTVRKKDSPKSALPEGMARTAVSTYKVDESIEAELNAAPEWDGTTLQKARVYRNATIDQISDATRISRTYLMAVETNDYSKLPAPVFVRGFVIQISRVLGLDENKVAASYMKLFRAKTGK